MAGIQFINTNPAIDQFNAQVQRGDIARRQEEQDFRQRFQFEQGQGADRAIREGILADLAARRAAPRAAVPPIAQFQAQPQAPAPAAPAMDAQSFGTGGFVPPRMPAQAGAPGSYPEVMKDLNAQASREQTEPSPFGDDPRLPPSQTAPAITTVQAQPAPAPAPARAAPQAHSSDALMESMAKASGTGTSLLTMYAADQTSRRSAAVEDSKVHMEGLKLMSEAMKEGNLQLMRVIDEKYQVFPSGALQSKEVAASIAAGNNIALVRRLSPEQAVVFGVAYTEAKAAGADENTALGAGMKKASQMAPKEDTHQPHYYTDDRNNVQAVGRDRIARPVQGPKARPPQPPFALTAAGVEQRDQQLWDKAGDNVRQRLGRMASPLVTPDAEFERLRRIEYESMRKRGMGASAAAPPSKAAPKRFKFDAQGNQIGNQ